MQACLDPLDLLNEAAPAAVFWEALARYPDGQLASMKLFGATTTSKTYDGFGRPATTATPGVQNATTQFDALGNLIARADSAAGQAPQTFAYDRLNRLTTQDGTPVAAYDAAGNLSSRAGVGGYTYFSGSHRVQHAGGHTLSYDANGNVLAIAGPIPRSLTYLPFNLPIGRFLQADPFVQAPYDGQSYNRYSYVMNNPLSLTDPSGYSARWLRPILAIAAAITMQYYIMPALLNSAVASAVMTQATANFIGAVAAGFAAGGIGGGNIESALQGALFAAAFYGAGEWSGAHAAGDALAFGSTVHLAQTAAHAVVGCVQAATAGGSCGRGALSAGFAAFAGPALPGEPGSTARLVATVVAGGTASKLSGGNFANGATTAAFGYLFNDMGLEMSVDGSNVPAHESPAPAGLTITISALGMGGAVTLDSFGQVYGSFGTQMPDVLNVSLTYQAVLLDGVTPQSRAALAKKTEHFFKGATVSLGWNGVLLGGGTSMSPGAGHSYDISAGIKLKGGSPIPVAGSASVTPSCFNCPN